MPLNQLTAISPIDGRYRSKTKKLDQYFSEFALIKYRVLVEIEYFIALSTENLSQIAVLSSTDQALLRDIYKAFSLSDAERIKKIERTTNHDVKAVEYFIKERLDSLDLDINKEWIHFGLTSQDINNTAVPLSCQDAICEVYLPALKSVVDSLDHLANENKNAPILSRTHGQAASPSTLGKEIKVFVERLNGQLTKLKSYRFYGKFGGATGNFNAHYVAFPNHNWADFGKRFLNDQLKLERIEFSTQIDHYDHLAELFHILARINTIFIDLARDVWTYVSLDYFKQKIVKGEVGSSAMPHKVNPIDFENAEGNLGIANALLYHLAEKLPISRLQRDLTDSTVLRNLGVPFGNMQIALNSLTKGLGKLIVNNAKLNEDLEQNWLVVAEAIQTIMRREGIEGAYELLKDLTRNHAKVGRAEIHAFIDELALDASLKAELKAITPQNYIGNANLF